MTESEKSLLRIIGSVIDDRPITNTFTADVLKSGFSLAQSNGIVHYYGAAISSNLMPEATYMQEH